MIPLAPWAIFSWRLANSHDRWHHRHQSCVWNAPGMLPKRRMGINYWHPLTFHWWASFSFKWSAFDSFLPALLFPALQLRNNIKMSHPVSTQSDDWPMRSKLRHLFRVVRCSQRFGWFDRPENWSCSLTSCFLKNWLVISWNTSGTVVIVSRNEYVIPCQWTSDVNVMMRTVRTANNQSTRQRILRFDSLSLLWPLTCLFSCIFFATKTRLRTESKQKSNEPFILLPNKEQQKHTKHTTTTTLSLTKATRINRIGSHHYILSITTAHFS